MSLKYLTTQSMIALSGAWLENEGEKKLLEAYPMTAAMIPALQEAHDGLIETQPAAGRTVAKEEALKEEQIEKDGLHDRKARGVYMVLEGFGALVDDPELRARLYGLLDRLFSTGDMEDDGRYVSGEPTEEELLLASLSDEERARMASEAGPLDMLFEPFNVLLNHVELVEQRLSDADRDQLASMVHPEGNLLKTYDECIGTAR